MSATEPAWERAVAAAQGNILQTPAWGQLKTKFGWSWDIVTVGNPQWPEAGALILYKPLPLHLGTLAYIPRGPVVDWANEGLAAHLFLAIEARIRQRRAWALWVEPELRDTPENRARLERLELRASTHTVQPPRTILVDIGGSEEAILAAMKQKTRYNIRLAERKGVTVREGTLDEAATFYGLITETGSRDAFGIHSEAYYRQALALFQAKGNGALLLAEVEGEPVAGLMVFALGATAWYFYGASSNRHREKMPPYALQWAAIRWAKAHDCTTYDLWGIPDADEAALEAQFETRDDDLWGVYRFKRGFGGQVTRYVGLWEKSLHPLYPLAQRLWRNRN